MGVGHKLTVDMPCYMFGEGKKGLVLIRQSMRHILIRLASSGPYGPLLARSGYPGQDTSFDNNQMVMICSTVNAPKQFYASLDESVQPEMLLCS